MTQEDLRLDLHYCYACAVSTSEFLARGLSKMYSMSYNLLEERELLSSGHGSNISEGNVQGLFVFQNVPIGDYGDPVKPVFDVNKQSFFILVLSYLGQQNP